MSKTTFALMYPGSLNLHGEIYSAAAFEKTCNQLGVEAKIESISSFTDKLPEKADIWFFGPGELTTLKLLLSALNSQKIAFEEHLKRGGYVIAVGNTGAIFGESLTLIDGTQLEGLGLLPMTATERKMIVAEDLIFNAPLCNHPISGYQNMRYDFETTSPLGSVVHGWGNKNDGKEGCVSYDGRMIFTNCMGPLLVKNPWLTQALIGSTAPATFTNEQNAQTSLEQYIVKKPKSKTLL